MKTLDVIFLMFFFAILVVLVFMAGHNIGVKQGKRELMREANFKIAAALKLDMR